MADERCRVTVIGTNRRVDVAVPAWAPVGEYVARLARLCGQATNDLLPPAWSLTRAGAAPLRPGSSLAEAGVVDGEVLHLIDLAEGETDEPLVADIAEVVAAQSARLRARSLPRGALVMLLGLAWLVGAATYLVLHDGASEGLEAASLAAVGLVLLTLSWALTQRLTPVPAAVRLAVSLSAVPCLAVAGALIADAIIGERFRLGGAVAGANVAAIMALAALPEAVNLAVELQLGAAAVIAPLLILLRADAAQTAAAVTVVAVALLATSPWLAGTIASSANQRPRGDAPNAQAVTDLLIGARRLLTVVTAGPLLALAIALPVLALSTVAFAPALAVVASVGLLIRTRQTAFTAEVLPMGAAGLIGLFAVVCRLRLGPWSPIVLMILGTGVLVAGILAALRRREAPPPAGSGGETFRRRLPDLLGLLCTFATAPLALGVFGVFAELTGMGAGMVY